MLWSAIPVQGAQQRPPGDPPLHTPKYSQNTTNPSYHTRMLSPKHKTCANTQHRRATYYYTQLSRQHPPPAKYGEQRPPPPSPTPTVPIPPTSATPVDAHTTYQNLEPPGELILEPPPCPRSGATQFENLRRGVPPAPPSSSA